MKERSLVKIGLVLAGLLLLVAPHMIYGQSGQAPRHPPPVGAQLVREGDFAAALEEALGLGARRNETEAESRLAGLGILPRNGWMADYPVTPDILGELQEAVGTASISGKLSLRRDDALNRFGEVASDAGLLEKPFATSGTYTQPGAVESYRDQGVVSDYYDDQGPPVVTYYAPPPDYYDLYSFVPYPFWYSTFWFPGFFVLRDFHKYHGHGSVSNHFTHATTNSFARVDPVSRAQGGSVRTFNVRGSAPTGRRSAPSGMTASGPRIITIGASRAAVPQGGFTRAASPPVSVSRGAIRTFGAPRAMMFSSPRTAMVSGGARGLSSFGGYHGSSIGGSSFRGGSFGGGGGARSGGGHRR